MSLDLDKSNWTRVAFGDVVRNVNNTTKDPSASGIQRVIAMEHMDPGELKINRWGNTEEGTTFTRLVSPGQTLFGKRRAYQRKVAFAEFEAVCSGDIYTFEAVRDALLPELLPFVVQSDEFFKHALGTSAGSLSPRTNWRDLSNFEFTLPPLEEQQHIANLLWEVERHSRSVHDLLTSTQQLLGCLREHEFSRISVTTKASDAFSITIGRQRSPKHQQGDHLVPYLRSANITRAGIDVGDVKKMNFTPAEQQKYSLREGDVLVTEASASEHAVGMPAVWREDLEDIVCFQNTLLRFRALPGISLPGYVKHWSHWAFESGAFLAAASGTNIKHIGARGASNMWVPLPGIADQQSMVARFDNVEKAGRSVLSELESLKSLKLTLLNEIFGDN